MSINDLTIGEAKELANLFSNKNTSSVAETMIGQYVIVRSRNEGVNAGKVLAADETGVVLQDARRIWRHYPKDTNLSWYEGVAESGLSEKSAISGSVERKVIIEDYSMTLCTATAEKSIREFKANAQD